VSPIVERFADRDPIQICGVGSGEIVKAKSAIDMARVYGEGKRSLGSSPWLGQTVKTLDRFVGDTFGPEVSDPELHSVVGARE